MSEMIERVAKGMHEFQRLQCTAWVIGKGKDPKTVDLPQFKFWDALDQQDKNGAMRIARAAMEAMLDPTDEMAEAMFNACRDIPRTGVVPEDIERAFDCWRGGLSQP